MKKYGLTERFAALVAMYPEYTVGRILSQEKGMYQMVSAYGEKSAEVSGNFAIMRSVCQIIRQLEIL